MMKMSKITKIINLILLMIIFIIHLSEAAGITSLHPGYNGEAEFNTWDTGSPVITFPFINTKTEWKWQTEIVVQNVGIVSNNINFKSYDLGGSLVGNLSIQLNPGANQIYSPPTNFSGSLVLTGTQPLTAMVVGKNLDPSWSGDRLISYKGAKINSGINQIQLYPIQKNNNGGNSILAVQNQEGLGAAAIKLNFTNLSDGVTTTLTDSLPAYSSKYYDISGFTILGDSFNGSVDIQADQTVTGWPFLPIPFLEAGR